MKRIYLMALPLTLLISCSDLFDINPPTEVKAEELFSQEQGFYDALMGVYVDATQSALYGRQFSYGFIDILVNMYTVVESSANVQIQDGNYENMYVKPATVAFWKSSYNLIANCNNILEYMPGKEALFYPGNYQLLEAETRAFRAFLHFDLLRLYASSPKYGAGQKAIPYVDAISKVPFPQLTVNQVLDKVIADLERSWELLKMCDPLLEKEPQKVTSFMDYLTPRGFRLGRNCRFNYYTVSALLARVYLYKGDLQKAYFYAHLVYESDYAQFGNINTYTWTEDVLTGFWQSPSTVEYNSRVYFSGDAGDDKLQMNNDARREIFEVQKYQSVDVRNLKNFAARNEGSEIFLGKYFNSSFCYPVIKRSEAYLILAETATANQDDPYKFLNELRQARGLLAFPLRAGDDLEEEIRKEYCKEFIGEGQLFYYYKRKNASVFKGNNLRNVTGMGDAAYCLPVPDDEKNFGRIE